MTRTPAIALFILCALSAGPAAARNDEYHLALKDVLDSPEFRQKFGNGMPFYFADQPAPNVERRIAEFIGNGSAHYNGRTEPATCHEAFLDALRDLKQRIVANGGDAILNITSYFRHKNYSSAEDYECHAGARGVKVTLRGVVGKIQR